MKVTFLDDETGGDILQMDLDIIPRVGESIILSTEGKNDENFVVTTIYHLYPQNKICIILIPEIC